MVTPDDMGADRHNELENMRAANQEPSFTHDVVAISPEGDVVFKTESLYSNEVAGALADYPEGNDAPEGVDHYEILKR